MEQTLDKFVKIKGVKWNGGGDKYRTNVLMDSSKCKQGRHGPNIWLNGALKLVNPSANYSHGVS
jgi:hypothetical protein